MNETRKNLIEELKAVVKQNLNSQSEPGKLECVGECCPKPIKRSMGQKNIKYASMTAFCGHTLTHLENTFPCLNCSHVDDDFFAAMESEPGSKKFRAYNDKLAQHFTTMLNRIHFSGCLEFYEQI